MIAKANPEEGGASIGGSRHGRKERPKTTKRVVGIAGATNMPPMDKKEEKREAEQKRKGGGKGGGEPEGRRRGAKSGQKILGQQKNLCNDRSRSAKEKTKRTEGKDAGEHQGRGVARGG